ncbi:MAG: ABC transporter ATP-binding protein [Verrucomicrobiota bacterium]|jgi:molybdate transport system ATP-binding protein
MNHGLRASFVKRFDGAAVIEICGLALETDPEITVLFGPSGCGKTTVLRCLAGLERPDEGTILFGEEVWFASAGGRPLAPQRRRVGFVPQDYALFPHLSVEGNIGYGLHGLPARQSRARVAEAMGWLGLAGLEQRRPGALSGGQQQRVALARALVVRPRLLLLDEPLCALDAPARSRVRNELRRMLRHLSIPTLLVTHDRADALALGDTLWVMNQGKLLQHGLAHEVFSRPADLDVAAIVAVETVQPGRILKIAGGLATVAVGPAILTALPLDLEPVPEEVYVCIRAEEVILVKGPGVPSSARNCLAGTVCALVREGPMVRARLDCGFPLAALLTRQACEEMSLRQGDAVSALIKAPQIHLIPRPG